ncbi:hypothetical protein BV22DRAFT_1030820 [Leucogyrophana mollusca]|uniref:Uncharacterized protein n=1 Tax=Leucogyrophana mollusca TaxID=85980 RepID=A0ACB8BQW5_9AGAM|nr:hypothetical protein BV22DRAFT_1030820 [Leucogyrophana mollusca]
MSAADSCLGALCGGCCLVLGSALTTWCNLNAFGANVNCCSQRGCCGCCCQSSFDDDNFDEQMKREMERTQQDRPVKPVDTQPVPSQNMSASTSG